MTQIAQIFNIYFICAICVIRGAIIVSCNPVWARLKESQGL
jgi:hypothetical protein